MKRNGNFHLQNPSELIVLIRVMSGFYEERGIEVEHDEAHEGVTPPMPREIKTHKNKINEK